jgi:hypothetical protein
MARNKSTFTVQSETTRKMLREFRTGCLNYAWEEQDRISSSLPGLSIVESIGDCQVLEGNSDENDIKKLISNHENSN